MREASTPRSAVSFSSDEKSSNNKKNHQTANRLQTAHIISHKIDCIRSHHTCSKPARTNTNRSSTSNRTNRQERTMVVSAVVVVVVTVIVVERCRTLLARIYILPHSDFVFLSSPVFRYRRLLSDTTPIALASRKTRWTRTATPT